jgi:Subtilase family
MLRRIVLFVPVIVLLSALPAPAQPLTPPPPESYDVLIRYQIEAQRNERVAQYLEMMRDLRRAGFVRDPDEAVDENEPENSRANRLRGVIAPERVLLLLKQRHIRTIALTPSGKKLPGAEELVRVHLDLTAGLPLDRQRLLYQQARDVLTSLGFQEATGYDHRHFSRFVGLIPVKNLDALVSDLRRQPQAWKLLSNTLLSELPSVQNGQQALEDLLTDWFTDKDGKKLVQETLQAWSRTPTGQKLLRTLPLEVINEPNSPVLQEQLLANLMRSSAAKDVLAGLLESVYASPAAQKLVDMMLRRISTQASGAGLPPLFRGGSTIRVVEVFSDMAPPSIRPIPKPVPPALEKFTPELRELLGDQANAATPMRLEVIYALTAEAEDRNNLLRRLGGTLDLVVEGRVGPIATVFMTLETAKALAAFDEIAVIRKPRQSQPLPLVPQAERKPLPLQEAGVARLHAMGDRGKGTVVAVLDNDFRGWEAQWKEKKLPPHTRLHDLTRERHRRFDADPFPGNPQELGAGTRYALTVAAVAPEVELMLLRVDPAAPYMIQSAARAINGEGYHSLGMEQHLQSLDFERVQLDRRKELLLQERREVYGNFAEEGEPAKKRDEYRQKQAQYDKDEADYHARVALYFQLLREFSELKRVRVAVSSLVWNEGHPVDGSSPLSRYFDDRPFKAALWFQAGGDARGQVWSGLFRDDDGDGAMKFAGPETLLQKGLWSHEFNFLKWQPANAAELLELPPNVRIRLSLQWREAHDPLYLQAGEDRYRDPLANLRLVLVQQSDPEGRQQPSDDVVVIAESVGPPQRLLATANSATYEQTLEVRVTKPGRYAVRIEGRLPNGVAPVGAAVLPSMQKFGELKPRLFVQTLEGPEPGRVLLHTYWTDAGSLGMPADARQVIAVGAVNRQREREPYSSRGPAQGMDLLVKPDVLAYDDFDGVVYGSAQAAAFAAGLAAVTQNANAPVRNWAKALGLQPGEVIRVPENWPR